MEVVIQACMVVEGRELTQCKDEIISTQLHKKK